MTQAEHMEVAPRMWDKTIAAKYTHSSKKTHEDPSDQSVDTVATIIDKPVVVAGGVLSLASRLKSYLIPALFVVCLIVVVYVTWTYFTKYRNARKEDNTNMIAEDDIKRIETARALNPQLIIQTEDMTKYEYDSDDSEEETKSRLSAIQEESSIPELLSSDDEEEEPEGDDDSDDQTDEEFESDSEDDIKSEPSQPDIDAIQELISTTQFDDTIDHVDTDDFSFTIDSYVGEDKPPTSRLKRKTKRVTL
jgi:tRNA_anti-like